MEGMKCEAGGGEGWPGGESSVALRSPADAPSAPPSFPSFCAQHGSSLFGAGEGEGGDWQAISDVMPAVQ